MSDEPKKRKRHWIWWTVAALLVLYPLSIGPATWFVANGRSGLLETWDTAYAPLLWACNHSDTLSGLLGWYMGLSVSPVF
jgi:hypothetical protein